MGKNDLSVETLDELGIELGDMGFEGHSKYGTKTCRCGRRVELWSAFANQCECGREYNGCGQALAPRSQWGEETGEVF